MFYAKTVRLTNKIKTKKFLEWKALNKKLIKKIEITILANAKQGLGDCSIPKLDVSSDTIYYLRKLYPYFDILISEKNIVFTWDIDEEEDNF